MLIAFLHFEPGQALNYAAINATILAIFFATLSALFVIAAQTLDSMETALFEKAHEINGLRLETRWDPNKELERLPLDDLLARMMEVVRNAMQEAPSAPPLDDPEVRGRFLVQGFTAIESHFPFSGGPARDGITPSPLTFSSEEEIRRWLKRLEEAVRLCDRMIMFGRIRMEEMEREGYGETIAKMRRDFAEAAISLDFLRTPVEAFTVFVTKADDLQRATEVLAQQLDRYRARLPSRRVLLASVACGTGLFASGVVYPMIDTTGLTLFAAWIPAFAYLAALGGVLVQVWRRYPSFGS